jgi:biopolymer transport protein ExbD
MRHSLTTLSTTPSGGFMNDINMTPFIDVILVLLIIFMITLPVLNRAAKIELPKTALQQQEHPQQNMNITIDANGQIYWNSQAVDDAQLSQNLQHTMATSADTTIHIAADTHVPYGRVALVMSEAQKNGLNRLDFVMQPETATHG